MYGSLVGQRYQDRLVREMSSDPRLLAFFQITGKPEVQKNGKQIVTRRIKGGNGRTRPILISKDSVLRMKRSALIELESQWDVLRPLLPSFGILENGKPITRPPLVNGKCHIKFLFYGPYDKKGKNGKLSGTFKKNAADLSNLLEFPQDVLQRACSIDGLNDGIIADDNLIRDHSGSTAIHAENPDDYRTEIYIYPLSSKESLDIQGVGTIFSVGDYLYDIVAVSENFEFTCRLRNKNSEI